MPSKTPIPFSVFFCVCVAASVSPNACKYEVNITGDASVKTNIRI